MYVAASPSVHNTAVAATTGKRTNATASDRVSETKSSNRPNNPYVFPVLQTPKLSANHGEHDPCHSTQNVTFLSSLRSRFKPIPDVPTVPQAREKPYIHAKGLSSRSLLILYLFHPRRHGARIPLYGASCTVLTRNRLDAARSSI
jgi:hypothetical protein